MVSGVIYEYSEDQKVRYAQTAALVLIHTYCDTKRGEFYYLLIVIKNLKFWHYYERDSVFGGFNDL